jgi:hypothetical protein
LRTKTKNLNNSLRHLKEAVAIAALGKTQKTNTTHRPMLEDTSETYRHLRSNKNKTIVNSSQIQETSSTPLRRIEDKTTTETRKKSASNSTTQSSDENKAKSDNSCVDARSLNVTTSKALIFTNKKNANNKLAYMLDKNYNNLAASSSSSLLLSSTSSSSSSSSSPLIIYNGTNTRKNIFKNNNNNNNKNINNSSSSIFNATKQPQTPPNIPTTTTTTNTIKTHLNKKISITSSSSLLLKKKYKKLLHGHRRIGSRSSSSTKTQPNINNNNNSRVILKRKNLIKLKNSSSKSKSSTAFSSSSTSSSSSSSSSSSISSFSTQLSNRSLTSHKYEADNNSSSVVSGGANSQLLASKNDDLNHEISYINRQRKTSFVSYSKAANIDSIDCKQNERKLINLFGRLKRSKSAVDLIKYGLKLNEEDDFKERNKLFKSKSLFNLHTTTMTTTNTPQVGMNEILHGQETHSSFTRENATKSPVNGSNESIDDDVKNLNLKEEKLGDGLTNGFVNNKSYIKKEEDEEEALVDKENFLETKKEFLSELLSAKKEQKVEDEILVDMGNEEIIDGFSFLTFELEDDLRVI